VWGIGSFENNEIKWMNPLKKFHESSNPTVKTEGYMKWGNTSPFIYHNPRIYSWVKGIKNRTKTVLTV
jgi:hypothetical protein